MGADLAYPRHIEEASGNFKQRAKSLMFGTEKQCKPLPIVRLQLANKMHKCPGLSALHAIQTKRANENDSGFETACLDIEHSGVQC